MRRAPGFGPGASYNPVLDEETALRHPARRLVRVVQRHEPRMVGGAHGAAPRRDRACDRRGPGRRAVHALHALLTGDRFPGGQGNETTWSEMPRVVASPGGLAKRIPRA